ncbi:MAG: TIM barrel protein [Acidobacteriota bacterium]
MVGGPDLLTNGLTVYRGDLRAAFRKLSEYGYEGVELMVRQPDVLNGEEIAGWLKESGLELAAICTGALWPEERLGLLKPDLTISRSAMARFHSIVDFAAAHFPPGVLINIGRSRGEGDPSRPELTLEVAAEAFRELADYALNKQVRFVLEPVTICLVNFIITAEDALRMVKRVARANFGLMLDVSQMNIEEASIEGAFREAREACWHIHVCDNNRRWPGSAHLDFDSIFAVLREIEYSGYVSTEMLAWPDSETAARCAIAHLRKLIPSRVSHGGRTPDS